MNPFHKSKSNTNSNLIEDQDLKKLLQNKQNLLQQEKQEKFHFDPKKFTRKPFFDDGTEERKKSLGSSIKGQPNQFMFKAQNRSRT